MADYIKYIRGMVGHKPILSGAGSVIVENEKGEILLGRRTDNHLWGYYGKLRPGVAYDLPERG